MRNIPILLLLLISQFSYSQIKDYFLPSDKYWYNTFNFESSTWENDNGEYQTKNQVKYSKDPSGNFKRYVFKQTLRYNIPEISVKQHQFFHISDSRVINIANYVAGISEALLDLGVIEDIKNKETVLMPPPAKWLYDEKSEIYSSYSSVKGELKTKYGYYPDCIIVTQQVRTKSKIKWTEKFYYAKGLGLVKTEAFENGKLSDVEMGFGTLVDDFSHYSFAQRDAKQRQLELKLAKEEKERKELNEFLSSRETMQYDFAEINSSANKDIEDKIKNFLIQEIPNSTTSLDFTCDISLTKDINGVTNSESSLIGLSDNNIKSKIDNYIRTIELPKSTMQGTYTINTLAKYSFNCSYKSNTCRVDKNDKKESVSNGCEKVIKEIENKRYPSGKYTAVINSLVVNDFRDEKIEFKSFKGSGGSGYAFLSLVVPGTGNYFVNGGKGSMLGENMPPIVTTIASVGLVGTGFYLKSQSNANYQLYHDATEQSDIDKYFDLANNQNKASYILIGSGAALWLWDVIWTAKTGSENKKANELMKNKLSFAPILLNNNNLGLGLTYNF